MRCIFSVGLSRCCCWRLFLLIVMTPTETATTPKATTTTPTPVPTRTATRLIPPLSPLSLAVSRLPDVLVREF